MALEALLQRGVRYCKQNLRGLGKFYLEAVKNVFLSRHDFCSNTGKYKERARLEAAKVSATGFVLRCEAFDEEKPCEAERDPLKSWLAETLFLPRLHTVNVTSFNLSNFYRLTTYATNYMYALYT